MSTRLGVRRPGFQAVSATDLASSATPLPLTSMSPLPIVPSLKLTETFPTLHDISHSKRVAPSLPSLPIKPLEPEDIPVSSMFFCTLLP